MVYSQQTDSGRTISLALSNVSWTSVMNGRAICSPVVTSYGFAVLSDARMIFACSRNGTVLWQRTVKGKTEPILSVLDGDFLLTVCNSSTINLISPSGLTLWSADTGFSIMEKPQQGYDGRIFVRGSKTLACYGMNGICKWKTNTDIESPLPLQELNDGSLLVFFSVLQDGKTKGLRISPFGEPLEEVIFSGIISSATTCSDGVLLIFAGGGAGLCSVRDGKEISLWALGSSDKLFFPDKQCIHTFFFPYKIHSAALIQPTEKGTQAILLRTTDGQIIRTLFFPGINAENLVCSSSSLYNGIPLLVFADDKRAVCQTEDGIPVWNTRLPLKQNSSSGWDYLLYTSSDELVFFTSSWAVTGFRILQNISPSVKSETVKSDYQSFYSDRNAIAFYPFQLTLDSALTDETITNNLRKGYYGYREAIWHTQLFSAGRRYFSYLNSTVSRELQEVSVFDSDMTGTDEMLSRLSLFGTNDFSNLIASLMTVEKNSTHLRTLLRDAEECAYDPDGRILAAFDTVLFTISSKDDKTLITLCDAIYSVCRFMGRPAFYTHGKNLLFNLLNPEYSNKVHEKARKTLIRIAELDI